MVIKATSSKFIATMVVSTSPELALRLEIAGPKTIFKMKVARCTMTKKFVFVLPNYVTLETTRNKQFWVQPQRQ